MYVCAYVCLKMPHLCFMLKYMCMCIVWNVLYMCVCVCVYVWVCVCVYIYICIYINMFLHQNAQEVNENNILQYIMYFFHMWKPGKLGKRLLLI